MVKKTLLKHPSLNQKLKNPKYKTGFISEWVGFRTHRYWFGVVNANTNPTLGWILVSIGIVIILFGLIPLFIGKGEVPTVRLGLAKNTEQSQELDLLEC